MKAVVVKSRRSLGACLSLALVATFAAVPAFAQSAIGFDSAGVLAIVTEATTFIVTVGLAVLALLMVAKGIKWARKAG